ncbi:hypothetical protein BZA05DRAFT_443477 [Tricharina praecox]|uniref:uncharacterized protein n=1 Tax=Tricharina praecox TaxID=43433 RepID=UPI00221F4F2C|nr:uncharacterized protein BZA05DRAFT_443477 [Tricharina praecox]KAI5854836.1 hypothetical protein BZA05DRAFT_443477 [Tricharina praecox]
MFSKEPPNLTNVRNRMATLIIKHDCEDSSQKPTALFQEKEFERRNRGAYSTTTNFSTKNHYRPDLVQDTAARTSATPHSHRGVKESHGKANRGSKGNEVGTAEA